MKNTASRILASTGANIAGLVGIAGLLLGVAAFIRLPSGNPFREGGEE